MVELIEKTVSNIFIDLDQVGKDYLLQMQHTRLNHLANTIMCALDMIVPENIIRYGNTNTILNLRLMLEMAIDETLTDTQEKPD